MSDGISLCNKGRERGWAVAEWMIKEESLWAVLAIFRFRTKWKLIGSK
jgi:hypothetical protein